MTLATIPNAEKIVGNYLRTHADLTGTRVVGKTPDDKTTKWVKVTMLDASNDPRIPTDHQISYLLQCDCYAGATGGQPEANTLGLTVRAVLNQMRGTFTGGTITGVRFSNMARIPDPDGFEPARERVVLDALVWAHP